MIHFKRVLIQRFGPFSEAELPLERQGLVLIRGENKDSTAADSNGAGKSHLFKAIGWCLFGATLDGRKDEVIQKGQKDAHVMVHLGDDTGGLWQVDRATGSNSWLRLYQGETDVTGATIKDTQETINQLLGMDWQTWCNTVMFGQGDLTRFADPATTDSERKAVLKRILRLDVLDRAQARIKQLEAEEKTKHAQLSSRLTPLAVRITMNQNSIEQTETEIKAKRSELKALSRPQKRMARLEALCDEMQGLISGLEAKREEANRLKDEGVKLASVKGNLTSDKVLLKEKISNAQKAINLFSKGLCPTCGTAASGKAVKDTIQKHKQEIDARSKKIEEVIRDYNLAHRQQEEAYGAARQLEIETADLPTWRDKLKAAQVQLSNEKAAVAIAKVAQKALDALEERLSYLKAEVDKDKLKQAGIDSAIAESNLRLSHLAFWNKGFSNQGLPSWMMDAIVPDLTERANKYLGLLSDGDLRISFDTQSVLKSGEARDKFAINLDLEGAANVMPSGGQRKKIAIGTDLALMDLVASRERCAIDLLMVDEIFDGLDATGRSRAMDLLAMLRQERSSILVISHDPAFAELFEREVMVVKECGVARVA